MTSAPSSPAIPEKAGIQQGNPSPQGIQRTVTRSAVFKWLGRVISVLVISFSVVSCSEDSETEAQSTASNTSTQIELNEQLFKAVEQGDIAEVKRLHGKGADINATDKYGSTPLVSTLFSGDSRIEMETLLIQLGAKLDTIDIFGDTPLHVAANSQAVEAAALLIKNGADVNAKNKRGETPLFKAERMLEVFLFSLEDMTEQKKTWFKNKYPEDRQMVELLKSSGAK